MAQLDTLDIVVLLVLLLGSIAYFTKGTYWAKPKDPYASAFTNANGAKAGAGGGGRSIIDKLKDSNKNCVVFFGSQTGTAEDYAQRLAKEGYQRYGLKTMIADLEEYDFDDLNKFPDDCLAIFVMATYGEGEPTDNAVDFYEFISSGESTFSDDVSASDSPLSAMKYVTFGLGNNTYEHYNAMVRKLDEHLTRLGATRIGEAGEGDDGAGTMEEDFLAWKDPMWTALASEMTLEEREQVYEPAYEINEKPDMDAESNTVFLGEPNRNHLEGKSKGPFNASNPYIAPIAESRELFTDKTRNCLHLEVDVKGSNLSFTTGDHIAVWPTNAGREVERFLKMIGLADKKNMVISIKCLDSTAKMPFPSPTTFDSAVRYHMEIGAPVSRQFVSTLAQFAPNDKIKDEMTKMGSERAYFAEKVTAKNYNIAQFLEAMSSGEPWTNIPFSLFIEGLHKLQPRYYSISSSSLIDRKRIGITAVVDSIEREGAPNIVKGVTTNYLLALKQKQHGEPEDPHGLDYAINGPRNKYDGIHVPVHVRHSNFKLPSNPATPIIMVGPGTGVAPFRGFVQERAEQAKKGEDVGKTILFFGCRRPEEDFIYQEEWEVWFFFLSFFLFSPSFSFFSSPLTQIPQEYGKALGDKFELVTAFSRQDPKKKVYVQHRMKERAKEINEILENKGYFYVCGDAAQMAREVNNIVGQIMAQQRGMDESKGEELVKQMRSDNRYQEDVWS